LVMCLPKEPVPPVTSIVLFIMNYLFGKTYTIPMVSSF
jgi:hypothetical protein